MLFSSTAKTDEAGIAINRVASQQLNMGKSPVEYTEADSDSPRLDSLYDSKLLAMMAR